MGITRKSTWAEIELPAFLAAHAKTPFEWGVCDCCLFAADAVLALSGVDIAEQYRGAYHDQPTATAALQRIAGTESIADALARTASDHGLTEWLKPDGTSSPLHAQRGDLCAVSNAGAIIGGVVDVTGRFVACMSETGIVRLPLSAIVRAWHY